MQTYFHVTSRRRVKQPSYHHRVYVVLLNHPRAQGRPCYYVGMTGLPIEERFANHKRGYKCSHVVYKYGVELAWDLFDGIPAMPYEEAVLAEPTLADDLRDEGYLVFGPTNRVKRRGRRRVSAARSRRRTR
jgi:hypothetical protein